MSFLWILSCKFFKQLINTVSRSITYVYHSFFKTLLVKSWNSSYRFQQLKYLPQKIYQVSNFEMIKMQPQVKENSFFLTAVALAFTLTPVFCFWTMPTAFSPIGGPECPHKKKKELAQHFCSWVSQYAYRHTKKEFTLTALFSTSAQRAQSIGHW